MLTPDTLPNCAASNITQRQNACVMMWCRYLKAGSTSRQQRPDARWPWRFLVPRLNSQRLVHSKRKTRTEDNRASDASTQITSARVSRTSKDKRTRALGIRRTKSWRHFNGIKHSRMLESSGMLEYFWFLIKSWSNFGSALRRAY